jgi:hypothetical protein
LEHAARQQGCLQSAFEVERTGVLAIGCMQYTEADPRKRRAAASCFREWAEYDGTLKAKYELAASRPWLTVEPDEPFSAKEMSLPDGP